MTVRKPKAVRLSQTQTLLQSYISTPMLQQLFAWDFRFLTDVEFKLRIGKKISRRQRNILDEKIAEGPKKIPVIENNPLLDSLKCALEILEPYKSTQDFAIRVGGDMVIKMTKGIKPSEKQIKMIERFIKIAEDLKHVQPLSGEKLSRGHLVLDAASCYAQNYWYTHPSASRAIQSLRNAIQLRLPITDEQFSSAEHAVRGTLKKIDKPKFNEGDKCKVELREACSINGQRQWKKHFGIIIAGPFVCDGCVCYDVLVNSELQTRAANAINKR